MLINEQRKECSSRVIRYERQMVYIFNINTTLRVVIDSHELQKV